MGGGIEAAHGLSPQQVRRGRYKLGEGVTGQVVLTGQPMVDLMFELPSFAGIAEVTVGAEFFSPRREFVATRSDGTTERIPLPESA